MSEFDQIKQEVHRLLDEQASEDVIYSIYNQLQSAQQISYTVMSAREEEGLRRGLEDVAAGRLIPAEEVYAKLRAKYAGKKE